MKLKPLPFQSNSFINNTTFSNARLEFYKKEYVGKRVCFNSNLISGSGSILFEKGHIVKIRDIGYEWFNIEEVNGLRIEGLFSPEVFDEVQ